MKKFYLILMGIFLFNFISGISICVDIDPPSLLNSKLTIEQKGPSVYLNWTPAEDEPACSGIDYYDIYRSYNDGNFSKIASTTELNYTDEGLRIGNYEYMIHAWDLAGHNEGNISVSVYVFYSSGNGGSPGGGRGATTTYWKCGEWGECVDGIQKRNCEDIDRKRQDKTELKECSVELEPLGYGGNNEIENENSEKSNYQSYLTSAVTGVTDFAKSKKGIAFFSVLIGIVLLLIIMKIYRLKFKN